MILVVAFVIVFSLTLGLVCSIGEWREARATYHYFVDRGINGRRRLIASHMARSHVLRIATLVSLVLPAAHLGARSAGSEAMSQESVQIVTVFMVLAAALLAMASWMDRHDRLMMLDDAAYAQRQADSRAQNGAPLKDEP